MYQYGVRCQAHEDCVSCIQAGCQYGIGEDGYFECVRSTKQFEQHNLSLVIKNEVDHCTNLTLPRDEFYYYYGIIIGVASFLILAIVILSGKIIKNFVDLKIHEEYLKFVSLYTRLNRTNVCIDKFCEDGMLNCYHKLFGPYIRMRLKVERKLANKTSRSKCQSMCICQVHGFPLRPIVQHV